MDQNAETRRTQRNADFLKTALLLWLTAVLPAHAVVLPYTPVEPGRTVVVVYNSRLPESKQVAEYYAQRRQVPPSQVLGFDLPLSESITRQEFIQKLQLPLWRKLEETKLLSLAPATNMPAALTGGKGRMVVGASFRYVALCYGVPVKILSDTNLVEPGTEQLRSELRRNEASVDSDLACLPLTELNMQWAGPKINPFYGATNASLMNPVHGVLLVTRLDGPSPEIARGLVDKAMEAETNGLWGRAYIDSRGITNGNYRIGDDWMRAAAILVRNLGFETELDENPGTFTAGHPMSHIAFYAGWYDENVSGPFTRGPMEFMPGAFAYHLHSFSAQVLRSTNQNWVGPLLAKGATITMGSVAEPYLTGTPDLAVFVNRLLYYCFSFGEAAYAAQYSVSWQTVVIGDPLYRPFARHPGLIQADLEQRGSKLLELCHLRLLNLQQAGRTDPDTLIDSLERSPLTRRSAVLMEKLADLCWQSKRLSEGLDRYENALKLDPSPQQRLRLLLTVARKREFYGPDKTAYEAYQRVLRDFPDYPEALPLYEKLLGLARKLEKKDDAARWEQAIQRLSPPAPKPKPEATK